MRVTHIIIVCCNCNLEGVGVKIHILVSLSFPGCKWVQVLCQPWRHWWWRLWLVVLVHIASSPWLTTQRWTLLCPCCHHDVLCKQIPTAFNVLVSCVYSSILVVVAASSREDTLSSSCMCRACLIDVEVHIQHAHHAHTSFTDSQAVQHAVACVYIIIMLKYTGACLSYIHSVHDVNVAFSQNKSQSTRHKQKMRLASSAGFIINW
jgi:hypothetical protein